MHVVQLAAFEAPEDVLDGIAAPAEIRGVPAEKVALPVRQELRIVQCAPAAGDGIALEVDVDAALPRFLEQLLMGDLGIPVHPRQGSSQGGITGSRRARWRGGTGNCRSNHQCSSDDHLHGYWDFLIAYSTPPIKMSRAKTIWAMKAIDAMVPLVERESIPAR